MSNPLSAPAPPRTLRAVVATEARPTANPSPAVDTHQAAAVWMALSAAGTLVLAVWLIRRLAYPRKTSLVDAPGRPNRLGPLTVAGLFLAYVAVQGLAMGGLKALWPDRETASRLIALYVGAITLTVGSLVLASMTFRHGIRRGLGLSGRHASFDAIRAILAYLAILPVCRGLLWLSVAVLDLPDKAHGLLPMLTSSSTAVRSAAILAAVLLGPIAEELFFRGIVQSGLRRWLGRPWPAVLASSALFALVHAPLWQTVLPIFALGVALGYNYERSGRLIAPIGIHVLFNGVQVGVYLLTGAG